jgi:hypothetical protein
VNWAIPGSDIQAQAQTLGLLLERGAISVSTVVSWADATIVAMSSPPTWVLDLALLTDDEWLPCVDALRKHGRGDGNPSLFFAVLAHCMRSDADSWASIAKMIYKSRNSLGIPVSDWWCFAGCWVLELESGEGLYDLEVIQQEFVSGLTQFESVDITMLRLDLPLLSANLKARYGQ